MKKLKKLSIVMSTILAVKGGVDPAVYAMEPNNIAGEQSKQENSKMDEMKEQIQNELLRMLFFRPDLINEIKNFLPISIQWESMPNFCRTTQFLNLLKKAEIKLEGDLKVAHIVEDGQQKKIKKIIEEDNLELLQKEAEKDDFMNVKVEDSFLDTKYMRSIPILHYCVIKKAIKCFKFLILNGADPSKEVEGPYSWDCISVAICLGQWEMMKIIEERGINKLNNPKAWEAVALIHRNNLLKMFISDKNKMAESLYTKCVQKALEGAIRGNNLKGLKILIEQGADVNTKKRWGETPLHIAAESDAVKVAEVLISKGADINAKNNNGDTPLHSAAFADAKKVVERLVSKGANVNAVDKWGRSPLYDVVWFDAEKVAELLISKGANVNMKEEEGKTPLHWATNMDSVKVAKVLINKGADINAKDCDGSTPLHRAAEKDADKVAELLISKGANVNAKNNNGETSLHIAAERVINMLTSKEDSEGNTVPHWVTKKGFVKVAKVLISKGADVNAKADDGSTPLHRAAEEDAYKIAELLISKGANINVKNNNGETPLHIVAKKVITTLTSKEDDKGNIVPHWVSERGANKVAELLVSRGADINAGDEHGWTPLHEAAWYESEKVVELLISRGANINAKTIGGSTPLHWVADRDAVKVAELLISKGADIDAKDKKGKTPLAVALEKNSSKVAELLRSKGAKEE